MALVYSIFPVIATGIITVCYVGVWVTIKVNNWVIICASIKIKI